MREFAVLYFVVLGVILLLWLVATNIF